MRIAFCISGQPRFYKEGFLRLKKLISEIRAEGITVDLFLHCWAWADFVEKGKTTSFSPEMLQKELISLYEPLSMHVDRGPLDDFLMARGQEVSASLCNNLAIEYEKMQGFKYDYKVKTRYDYIPGFEGKQFVESLFEPKSQPVLKIYIYRMWVEGYGADVPPQVVIDDFFFYAKSEAMDEIMNLDRIKELHERLRKKNGYDFYANVFYPLLMMETKSIKKGWYEHYLKKEHFGYRIYPHPFLHGWVIRPNMLHLDFSQKLNESELRMLYEDFFYMRHEYSEENRRRYWENYTMLFKALKNKFIK